jgi:hypothetical protein
MQIISVPVSKEKKITRNSFVGYFRSLLKSSTWASKGRIVDE